MYLKGLYNHFSQQMLATMNALAAQSGLANPAANLQLMQQFAQMFTPQNSRQSATAQQQQMAMMLAQVREASLVDNSKTIIVAAWRDEQSGHVVEQYAEGFTSFRTSTTGIHATGLQQPAQMINQL